MKKGYMIEKRIALKSKEGKTFDVKRMTEIEVTKGGKKSKLYVPIIYTGKFPEHLKPYATLVEYDEVKNKMGTKDIKPIDMPSYLTKNVIEENVNNKNDNNNNDNKDKE